MSYPNHLEPHTPRRTINYSYFKNERNRMEFIKHGTAGITAFTIARLFMVVPIQNYKNASILSGEAFEEPPNVTIGQCTEFSRVIAEYLLKNSIERFLCPKGTACNSGLTTFIAAFLTAPLHIARVKESRGVTQDLVSSIESNFSVEKCFFLALHESIASALGNCIFDQGLFNLQGANAVRFEANLRLSQLLSRVLLTPLEIFAKRVAIADASVDNAWKSEYESMKREAKEKGYCKYLLGVAFWGIPEALAMVVEKVAYRQIVDNWPFS